MKSVQFSNIHDNSSVDKTVEFFSREICSKWEIKAGVNPDEIDRPRSLQIPQKLNGGRNGFDPVG